MRVHVREELLILLPQRAVFWEREKTLFVADLHLGKVETFHAAFVPVPLGGTEQDLGTLSRLIERFRPERLTILGDLIHARAGRKETLFASFADWRSAHESLEITLIRGNHDRGAGDPPRSWNLNVLDEPVAVGPFALRHYPDPSEARYTLAGHLHPAVVLTGSGRQKLKLPCFWFGDGVGVLPAFGSFTGTMAVQPRPGDRVFAVAEEEVIEVSKGEG